MTFDQLYDGEGMPSIPDILYKYVTSSTAKLILGNQTLRWSAPNSFNDPFDMRAWRLHEGSAQDLLALVTRQVVDIVLEDQEYVFTPQDLMSLVISRFKERRGALLSLPDPSEPIRGWFLENENLLLRKIEEQIETAKSRWENLHDVGVLCLSSKSDDILMWSHYADNHKGIVLGFRNEEETCFNKAKPIHYTQAVPTMLSNEGWVRIMTGQAEESLGLVLKWSSWGIALTKSKQWEYEQEWRCIAELDDEEDDSFTLREFPKHTLETVTFGCQCDETDKIEVMDIVRNQGYENAKLYQAKKHRDEFKLEFIVLE